MDTILTGRYQILKHLGGGGFGQTFLARDNHLPGHPLCVVKQLKPRARDLETLEIAKRLFFREAETLYRLGHQEQIPHLLAYFQEDEEFYLVQEYIEGVTLERELELQEKFDEPYILKFLNDILTVLSFVHQQGVIHRDIKPANLIRRERDRKIILIDFGAVKEVTSQGPQGQGETSVTVAVGSPGYMPSEQRSFKPHFSSDVYAVGIICLQALTGLHPQQLPRVPETGEFDCYQGKLGISQPLLQIIDRMVRYDYRQRYSTAKEALEELQKLLTGHKNDLSTVFIGQPSPQNLPTVLTGNVSSEPIEAKVLENCRRELAVSIGPFAGYIVEDILATYPNITLAELIEHLAAEIPTSEQAKHFKDKFSGLI
jgi:serine/threonine-protein kinase